MRGTGKIWATVYCLTLTVALAMWTFDYAAAPIKYRLGAGDIIDLTAVTKINQGAGSGLDADMVDGKHASDFVVSGTSGIQDTDIDWGLSAGQVNTDDIPEGSANKYFSGKTTDNLPEGSTNKYIRTKTKIIYLESPTATDLYPITFIASAVTFREIRGVTDTGTVDFNVEYRDINTPGTTGTEILTSNLQANALGSSTTGFNSNGQVAADKWLFYKATAVASSPTKLWAVVEYEMD